MTTGLTILYTSFIYYCCLLLFARYILSRVPAKSVILSSFVCFFPLIVFILSDTLPLLCIAYIAFQALQFILIKVCFRGIKIRSLVFFYVILFCFNIVIASLLVVFIPKHFKYLDICVNTSVFILWICVCLTKARSTIQQMLNYLPKTIAIISALLLIFAALISAMTSYFQQVQFPEVWIRWIQISTSFLLMAICLVVPVIFIISISNTRLKTLTADYEQQIHVQAEHYKNLARANYEVRRFRHDFKNIRIAIENLLERGEYDEALKLIYQCNDYLESPGEIHSAFDTGNGIADALLTDKQEKALSRNTHIAFKGIIPTESLSPTDLCVILGNTLDNALEACQKLPPQDSKTISVSCNCSSGFLFLTITNPIAEKVVIHNNHIVTTKENKTLHGFGLYSLHSIVEKYDGEIQISATDTSFTVNIDLCVAAAPQKSSFS